VKGIWLLRTKFTLQTVKDSNSLAYLWQSVYVQY
jgi:hypothetical protein